MFIGNILIPIEDLFQLILSGDLLLADYLLNLSVLASQIEPGVEFTNSIKVTESILMFEFYFLYL